MPNADTPSAPAPPPDDDRLRYLAEAWIRGVKREDAVNESELAFLALDLLAENARLAAKIEGLKEELQMWRPLTAEEAQKAFDEAEAVPLSDERIAEIVRFATDPSQ